MRLNATTTAATTTRIKTTAKTKAKQTLQASKRRRSSIATTARDHWNIECFTCNLIQLFILTTSIMCLASAIGSGLLQAQAQSQSQTQTQITQTEPGAGGSSNMDAFSGQSYAQQQQFDELLPPSELVTTAPPFQFSTAAVAATHTHLHTHSHKHSHSHSHTHQQQHQQQHTHMQAATTLRVSYDSNEIDNSYAAAAAGPAAAETDDVDSVANADSDADVDADADADADDVETVADDYVIALIHGQNTTKEKTDRAAATTLPTTAAAAATIAPAAAAGEAKNGKHLMNAKTQDLLSLSQLSSHQTSTASHEKNASSLKNSISSSSSSSSSNSGASSAGNFQQIGSQRVNGNVSPTDASPAHNVSANGQQVAVNGSLIAPTLSTSSSNVRTSAKKVESKFILPKQQKTDAPMLNYIFDTFSSANKHHHHDQRYGPHFEDVQRVGQPTNMTVQAGSSIHLNCRISLLQDKTVSWVRRSAQNEENGLDLLTVGLHAYTGDKRYKMEFQYPNNWRLKIINVKKDDEATYECQISTHPPRVIQINLHVNAPKVMIVDEYGDPLQEKYYEIDSTLQLSCVVRNVAMTSSVVFWKHSENVLNYDVTRGGVSVKTELMEDGANSTLFIAKIHKADSGNYTCSISEFQNFTIVVHILNGESFAELHHGAAGAGASATWQYIIGLYVFLTLLRWLRCSSR